MASVSASSSERRRSRSPRRKNYSPRRSTYVSSIGSGCLVVYGQQDGEKTPRLMSYAGCNEWTLARHRIWATMFRMPGEYYISFLYRFLQVGECVGLASLDTLCVCAVREILFEYFLRQCRFSKEEEFEFLAHFELIHDGHQSKRSGAVVSNHFKEAMTWLDQNHPEKFFAYDSQIHHNGTTVPSWRPFWHGACGVRYRV